MATPRAIAKISEIFDFAFGKPVDEKAYNLWLTLFGNISDADLIKAAFWLSKHREKSNKVTPGEMKGALAAIGVNADTYTPEKGFESDPVVRAMESRYRGEMAAEGVTMAEFLQQEGLSSFREAMEKYGDRPTATETILGLAEEEVPF